MKKNTSKNNFYASVVLVASIFVSGVSLADNHEAYIESIVMTRNSGFELRLEGVSSPCGSGNSNYIKFEDTFANYKEYLTMLLTTYTAGKKIGIQTGKYLGGDNVCDPGKVWTVD